MSVYVRNSRLTQGSSFGYMHLYWRVQHVLRWQNRETEMLLNFLRAQTLHAACLAVERFKFSLTHALGVPQSEWYPGSRAQRMCVLDYYFLPSYCTSWVFRCHTLEGLQWRQTEHTSICVADSLDSLTFCVWWFFLSSVESSNPFQSDWRIRYGSACAFQGHIVVEPLLSGESLYCTPFPPPLHRGLGMKSLVWREALEVNGLFFSMFSHFLLDQVLNVHLC